MDLAGSERLKKTQAEGERKKEGIRINEGLVFPCLLLVIFFRTSSFGKRDFCII